MACVTRVVATVANKPGAPRRSRISVKTAAQGMPDVRLNLWYLPPAFLFAGGPWARPSPGIPCALIIVEGGRRCISRKPRAAGSRLHARLFDWLEDGMRSPVSAPPWARVETHISFCPTGRSESFRDPASKASCPGSVPGIHVALRAPNDVDGGNAGARGETTPPRLTCAALM
jgi:hypothetical protein